jgi:hypothetical protein
MWIIIGLVAGVLAGIGMIAVSEAGYRLGIIKSNLIIVDGSFVMRLLNKSSGVFPVYVTGMLIHVITSIAFGFVYVVLAYLLNFDTHLITAFVPYIVFLWLAMLFVALPVAGQGMIGKKLGKFAWLEQLVLHGVYGLIFWWALYLGQS